MLQSINMTVTTCLASFLVLVYDFYQRGAVTSAKKTVSIDGLA